jgi:hypothetical protein
LNVLGIGSLSLKVLFRIDGRIYRKRAKQCN